MLTVFLQLYVRRKYFFPPSRVSDYYAAVVGQVRAESQAEAHANMLHLNLLTEDEQDVLRWGRNATGTSPKRFNQGGPSREVYRAATAVECLVSSIPVALLTTSYCSTHISLLVSAAISFAFCRLGTFILQIQGGSMCSCKPWAWQNKVTQMQSPARRKCDNTQQDNNVKVLAWI